MPFTNLLRCKIVRGAPAHLKSFVISLLLVLDLRVGDPPAQLDELNAVGLTGHRNRRGQVTAKKAKRSSLSKQAAQAKGFLWWHDLHGTLVLANQSRCSQA